MAGVVISFMCAGLVDVTDGRGAITFAPMVVQPPESRRYLGSDRGAGRRLSMTEDR
jgi:hypothetical protein